LIPYIYALAGQVTQKDYTMVRAMTFDFMEDPKAATISDQFMFGPAFMVCPVYTPGALEREVYFPSGTWFNFWTGEKFESKGETRTVAAPIKQIPVFVRAGSIVPMGPFIQYATEASDPTEVRIYMGADGSFELYEDEGNNYNYENGAFSVIPFEWNEDEKKLTIKERSGSFDGMLKDRTFNIVFVEKNYGFGIDVSEEYQVSVSYDGKEQSVTFDPNWVAPLPKLDPDNLPRPVGAPTPKHPEMAMVGEWSFDEGEGAKVKDSSGNFNHGALITTNSSVWDANGKSGSSIRYSNGTFVEVSNNDSFQMTDEISFSSWVNFAGGGHANILNKGGNGTNNPGFSFILLNGSQLQLEIQSAKNANGTTLKTTAISTMGFQAQAWHQVGFTWKNEEKGGDGIVRIYVDGVQVSNDAYAGNYFKGPIGLNGSGLRFGCSDINEPSFPNYFNGWIDEAKLFNYELTKEEMLTLSKGESITIANVSDPILQPGDQQITATWKDPEVSGLSDIKVIYTSVNTGETKELTINPGIQECTITGLNNGEFYYIAVKTVLDNGKESQGVNVVGFANDYPVTLDHILTHGTGFYGYGINHTSSDVSGELVAKVYDISNGEITLVNTFTQVDFTIPAQDTKQFIFDIGEYNDDQVILIGFVQGDKPLAQEKYYHREQLYIMFNSSAEVKTAINAEMEKNPLKELYTEESYENYDEVKELANLLLNNTEASQEECLAILNQLKTVLALDTAIHEEDNKESLNISEDKEMEITKDKNNKPIVIVVVVIILLAATAGIWYYLQRKRTK
jgi:hypothetical protein